jgi:hypothetical protein
MIMIVMMMMMLMMMMMMLMMMMLMMMLLLLLVVVVVCPLFFPSILGQIGERAYQERRVRESCRFCIRRFSQHGPEVTINNWSNGCLSHLINITCY